MHRHSKAAAEESVTPNGGVSEAIPHASERKTQETADATHRDHLVELDGLRGIAIITVVIGHATGQWHKYLDPLIMPGLGGDFLNLIHFIPGVPLFYLLSGYLLAWTEGNRARRGSYSLRSYTARRILRLVPAYYAAIVVVLLLWPGNPSFGNVLAHLTFTHGLFGEYARSMSPAFWSLTPEVVFYLLLPLIVLKLKRLWQRAVLFVLLVLASVPTKVPFLLAVGGRGDLSGEAATRFHFYASFPTTLLYLFLAGVLLRMLVEYLNTRPTPRWQPALAFVLFAASFLYMFTAPGLGIFRVTGLGPAVSGMQMALTNDLALILFFASALLGRRC